MMRAGTPDPLGKTQWVFSVSVGLGGFPDFLGVRWIFCPEYDTMCSWFGRREQLQHDGILLDSAGRPGHLGRRKKVDDLRGVR